MLNIPQKIYLKRKIVMCRKRKWLLVVLIFSMLMTIGCSKSKDIDTLSSIVEQATGGKAGDDSSALTSTSLLVNSVCAETAHNEDAQDIKWPIIFDFQNSDGSIKEVRYNSFSDINLNRPLSIKGNEVFLQPVHTMFFPWIALVQIMLRVKQKAEMRQIIN